MSRIRVLFVCMGNICRSPMAEAVFQEMVREAGLEDQFDIDSAGTTGYHAGQHAHSGTLKLLKDKGIDYQGRARQLTRDDLDTFDYVVAMDNENLADIQSLGSGRTPPKATIARLMDYAPEMGQQEVPDPFYNGGFPLVHKLVTAGGRGLLTHIRKEHAL